MKIVYLITVSDPIGGAQIHVRDLAHSFKELGHEVNVLVGSLGLFTQELSQLGIVYRIIPHLVRSIRLLDDLRAVREIRAALRELQPDLLTAHSSKAGWLGRLAGRSLGVPTLFTAHGWAFTAGVPKLPGTIYRLAETLAAPLAARIITVSDFDRKLALNQKVADSNKLVAVLNGVRDIAPDLWANAGQSPPQLIMVARFGPQKDHITLFKALALLQDLQWEINLVGDGPGRVEAEQNVQELGLTGRVHFLGERRDVAELISRSQIFLLISNWEGFPLSILEAMRAKLPVVASDVGGVREAVDDFSTGFLIPRGDYALLADRLRRLLEDGALRIAMAEKGRKRYARRFTVGHMVQRTLQVYQAAVKIQPKS